MDAAPPDQPSALDYGQGSDAKPTDTAPDLATPDLPAPAWKPATVATKNDLHAVACTNEHVFAVGAKGTILHRAPKAVQGGGFVAQSAKTQADLYAVTFALDTATNKSYGAVAGKDYQIWNTTDWGKHPPS